MFLKRVKQNFVRIYSQYNTFVASEDEKISTLQLISNMEK